MNQTIVQKSTKWKRNSRSVVVYLSLAKRQKTRNIHSNVNILFRFLLECCYRLLLRCRVFTNTQCVARFMLCITCGYTSDRSLREWAHVLCGILSHRIMELHAMLPMMPNLEASRNASECLFLNVYWNRYIHISKCKRILYKEKYISFKVQERDLKLLLTSLVKIISI